MGPRSNPYVLPPVTWSEFPSEIKIWLDEAIAVCDYDTAMGVGARYIRESGVVIDSGLFGRDDFNEYLATAAWNAGCYDWGYEPGRPGGPPLVGTNDAANKTYAGAVAAQALDVDGPRWCEALVNEWAQIYFIFGTEWRYGAGGPPEGLVEGIPYLRDDLAVPIPTDESAFLVQLWRDLVRGAQSTCAPAVAKKIKAVQASRLG